MLLLISKSFLYRFSSLNFEQFLVTGWEKRKPAVLMLSILKKFPGVGFQRIFSYVILQKILLLMIPKLALYDFFPGRTHYLSSTAILQRKYCHRTCGEFFKSYKQGFDKLFG